VSEPASSTPAPAPPAPPPRGPISAFLADWVFEKKVPARVGFLRALGTALLILLITQAITGVLLALSYVASPDHAYDSIRYIDEELSASVGGRTVAVGKLLRGMHHWGSSAVIVLAFLHLARVYFTGAYKKPRGLLWVVGVAILGVLLGFGFTGYLLPWDMKAFWATDVGINIVATIPKIGPTLADLMRGGPELGAPTLTRMFALHVLALPAMLVPLAALHLFLVHKLGITPPGARVGDPEVKSEPFFPDHAVRELLVAAVAIAIVAAIAFWLGPPLEGPANRDAKGYDPRPEWYFLGVFQLLKVPWFKGDNIVFATVVIPGALGLIALLLPWLDRNRERAPGKRPIAVAAGVILIGTMAGLTIQAARDLPKNTSKPPPYVPAGDGSYVPPSSPPMEPPRAKPDPNAPKSPDDAKPAADPARATLLTEGEKVMRSYECTNCHTYRGEGNDTGADAPEFVGLVKDHDAAWIELYLLDPKKVKPDVDMPSAADVGMSDADRKKLAEWLKALAAE
jgi:ubiquinol-cytochrome c reductase cytochrome b subunit